jgi:hypothetical protein
MVVPSWKPRPTAASSHRPPRSKTPLQNYQPAKAGAITLLAALMGVPERLPTCRLGSTRCGCGRVDGDRAVWRKVRISGSHCHVGKRLHPRPRGPQWLLRGGCLTTAWQRGRTPAPVRFNSHSLLLYGARPNYTPGHGLARLHSRTRRLPTVVLSWHCE